MKNIIFSLMGLLLFLVACNTLEDRPGAGSVLAPSQLTVSIVQSPAGSNSVKLVNTTKSVIMFWDWGTGTGHSASSLDTISAYLPFKLPINFLSLSSNICEFIHAFFRLLLFTVDLEL